MLRLAWTSEGWAALRPLWKVDPGGGVFMREDQRTGDGFQGEVVQREPWYDPINPQPLIQLAAKAGFLTLLSRLGSFKFF